VVSLLKRAVRFVAALSGVAALLLLGGVIINGTVRAVAGPAAQSPDATATMASQKLFRQGRQVFRFDTFGDQVWWGTRSSSIGRSPARRTVGSDRV
jgi:hypothetical protein